MQRTFMICMAVAFMGISFPREGNTCTTFLKEGGGALLVGKSYDWHLGQGMVVANKRGVKKTAVRFKPTDQPAKWVSRYASITFNQVGREFPNGGMNEAGLVVEVMWLNQSSYPVVDRRPSLNELQWIQYQLDRFGSVAEVVANAKSLRVAKIYGSVHYLVCDKSAACAAFEYLKGKLEISAGKAMPTKTLTNNTYAESREYYNRVFSAKKAVRVPRGAGSLERFARASAEVRTGGSTPERAFQVLDSVSQGEYTKWQIVYDLKRLEVYFRTHRQRTVKKLRLKAFSGACSEKVRAISIDHSTAGDISKSMPAYKSKDNLALFKSVTKGLNIPATAEQTRLFAYYPESLPCVVQHSRNKRGDAF
jgi:penicillin V acylase-like amidase (Ntn superfamily)